MLDSIATRLDKMHMCMDTMDMIDSLAKGSIVNEQHV